MTFKENKKKAKFYKSNYKNRVYKNLININSNIKYDLIFSKVNINDYFVFITKFLGSLISKGKRGHAIKFFNYLFLNLKKNFKIDPSKIMLKVLKNLVPFFVSGLKTFRGRTFYIPILVKGNKRNVLVIDWLVRLFRSYSNIWGIKKEDLLKSIIDSFYYRGIAMNIKKEQYHRAIASKNNLRTRYHHRYLIRLILKDFYKAKIRNYGKRWFKLRGELKKWRWRNLYFRRRKEVLNWKLLYYKQKKFGKGLNYKRSLTK